ncbi:MAG: hypothetical protein ACOC1O_00615 [bacterium]
MKIIRTKIKRLKYMDKIEDQSSFMIRILKEYSETYGLNVRSTSDLSPLEEYLLKKLYDKAYNVRKK